MINIIIRIVRKGITHISQPIIITVALIAVGDSRTIIYIAADTIFINIIIGIIRESIANIAQAVEIRISLVGVRDIRAVVRRVGDAITIGIDEGERSGYRSIGIG